MAVRTPATGSRGSPGEYVYVALLRGINVGTAKRVAMADLRKLVADLGYQDVRTLLNSGNVVFTAPRSIRGDHATRIEQAFASRLRFTSRVIVLSAAEVNEVVRENPLASIATNPSRLLISILARPADRARLAPLAKEKWEPEAFALGARVAYLWCPEGLLKSRVAESLNRIVGDAVTSRNWATILKLGVLTGGAG